MILNSLLQIKIRTMEKTRKVEILEYESPQMEMIQVESEQMLAGSAMLDHMTESEGAWDIFTEKF